MSLNSEWDKRHFITSLIIICITIIIVVALFFDAYKQFLEAN